tara:strand:- start:200 stop:733 length:534 start_codon:yes stop_codon:yes gene_type:complete
MKFLYTLVLFVFLLSVSVSFVAFDPSFYVSESVDETEARNVVSFFFFAELNEGYSVEELIHMEDVRNLLLLNIFLSLLLLCFYREVLSADLISYSLGAIGLVIFIAVFGYFSFDWLFTTFHEVLFFNDYWLLPTNSKLITLFPLDFFVHAFFQVVLYVLAFGLLFLVLGLHLKRSNV